MKTATIKLNLDCVWSDSMDYPCEVLEADNDNIFGAITVTEIWVKAIKNVHAALIEAAASVYPVRIIESNLDMLPGWSADIKTEDSDDHVELLSFTLDDKGLVTLNFSTHYSHDMFHIELDYYSNIEDTLKESDKNG